MAGASLPFKRTNIRLRNLIIEVRLCFTLGFSHINRTFQCSIILLEWNYLRWRVHDAYVTGWELSQWETVLQCNRARWIPLPKASDAKRCRFRWSAPEQIARALQRSCNFSHENLNELTDQQDMFCYMILLFQAPNIGALLHPMGFPP